MQENFITAYDCEKAQAGRIYSLMGAEECSNSLTTNITTSTETSYTIYQESEFHKGKVRECKVRRVQKAWYCGSRSYVAIISLESYPTYLPLDVDTCNKVFITGEIGLLHGKVVLKAKSGITVRSGPIYVAGKVTPGALCEQGVYTINGNMEKNVVVLHDYEVFIKETEELFDVATGGMMTRPYCKMEDGVCRTGESILIYKVNANECKLTKLDTMKFKEVQGERYKPPPSELRFEKDQGDPPEINAKTISQMIRETTEVKTILVSNEKDKGARFIVQ